MYESDFNNNRDYKLVINTNAKPIYQLDMNDNIIQKFNSTREAENLLKIDNRLINNVLKGRKGSTNNFKFRYVNDE